MIELHWRLRTINILLLLVSTKMVTMPLQCWAAPPHALHNTQIIIIEKESALVADDECKVGRYSSIS